MRKIFLYALLIIATCMITLLSGCTFDTNSQSDSTGVDISRVAVNDMNYRIRTMASPINPVYWWPWITEGTVTGSSNNPLDALQIDTLITYNKNVIYSAWERNGNMYQITNDGVLGDIMPAAYGDSEPGYTN